MSQNNEQMPELFEKYPAGPAVRLFLGLDESQSLSEDSSPVLDGAFEKFMALYIAAHPVDSADELAALIDELYKMGFAELAMVIHKRNANIDIANQFHGLLALGAAALMTGDVQLAEGASVRAQALAPQEVAPYFNAALAMQGAERQKDAIKWALSGLEVEKNHEPLWHLVVSENIQSNIIDFKDLWQRAVDLGSWVGVAILADSTALFTGAEALAALGHIYAEGERGEAFLVDYTGRLGQAQDFARISTIIWELQSEKGVKNWMLLWHGYQAQLAIENSENANRLASELLQRPDVPGEVKKLLQMDQQDPPELSL